MSYKIIEDYITPNKWSRPQKTAVVEWICIHWEAVVNAKAESVRNFFENRKYGNDGYGSAHEVLDNKGEYTLKLIPDNEMAYSVGSKSYTTEKYKMMGDTYPNSVVYSIECPTIDLQGNISGKVYNLMVERSADLLIEYGLDIDRLTLHGIIAGKDCHKYFCPEWNSVDYGRWNKFLGEVKKMYDDKLNNKPSDWARDAWNWAIETGLLDGSNPQEGLTREMYAQAEYNKIKKGE